MNDQRTTRILCHHSVDTDTVKKLAAQHWFLWNRIDRDDNQPLMYEWSTAAKDCRIRFVDDHRVGLRWLDVFGARPDEPIALIRRSLPVLDQNEILARATSAKTEDDCIWAAYMLAVFAPTIPFDVDFFGAFGDLANHRSVRVRYAIVYAMEQTRWSQLVGILDPMAEDDPDENVRNAAVRALGVIRAATTGG